jgi:hypothetical protein
MMVALYRNSKMVGGGKHVNPGGDQDGTDYAGADAGRTERASHPFLPSILRKEEEDASDGSHQYACKSTIGGVSY